jgi:hypothetical protein
MPNATLRSNLTLDTRQVAVARGPFIIESTVEAGAGAAAGTEYVMARIPANARIHGFSRLHFDDLASSGSPVVDIGLKAVESNVTTDIDALNDGIDVATAASNVAVIKDIANYGKRAWEHVAGQTTQPQGFLDVIVTTRTAAVNTGGTITLVLAYTVE